MVCVGFFYRFFSSMENIFTLSESFPVLYIVHYVPFKNNQLHVFELIIKQINLIQNWSTLIVLYVFESLKRTNSLESLVLASDNAVCAVCV